jgi:hypothetical protein
MQAAILKIANIQISQDQLSERYYCSSVSHKMPFLIVLNLGLTRWVPGGIVALVANDYPGLPGSAQRRTWSSTAI